MTRTWLKSDHRWQHWNRIVVILTKFSSLAASKVVILITFNAAGLENFIKMTTFLSRLPSMRERPSPDIFTGMWLGTRQIMFCPPGAPGAAWRTPTVVRPMDSPRPRAGFGGSSALRLYWRGNPATEYTQRLGRTMTWCWSTTRDSFTPWMPGAAISVNLYRSLEAFLLYTSSLSLLTHNTVWVSVSLCSILNAPLLFYPYYKGSVFFYILESIWNISQCAVYISISSLPLSVLVPTWCEIWIS